MSSIAAPNRIVLYIDPRRRWIARWKKLLCHVQPLIDMLCMSKSMHRQHAGSSSMGVVVDIAIFGHPVQVNLGMYDMSCWSHDLGSHSYDIDVSKIVIRGLQPTDYGVCPRPRGLLLSGVWSLILSHSPCVVLIIVLPALWLALAPC